MASYSQPFLDVTGQIARLKSKGMQIADINIAEAWLRRVDYYRLSGYSRSFRSPISDQYLPNSRFEDVVALYVFDKQLKMLVMEALEEVEVAVRVQMTLCLGNKGVFAYLDPTQLDPQFTASAHQEHRNIKTG